MCYAICCRAILFVKCVRLFIGLAGKRGATSFRQLFLNLFNILWSHNRFFFKYGFSLTTLSSAHLYYSTLAGDFLFFQNMLQLQCTVSSSSIIIRLRSKWSKKSCSGSSITLYCFQLSTRCTVAMDYPLETASRKVTCQRLFGPLLIMLPKRSLRFFESFPVCLAIV